MMKTFLFLFNLFLLDSTASADTTQIKEGTSPFDRSLFWSTGLCLPLLDGCNYRSKVNTCASRGDPCDGGVTCAKTTEGRVVCVAKGDSTLCESSRDCTGNQVCMVQEGGCSFPICVTQVRRGESTDLVK
ncbi:hypothetical protein FisN_9Lu241 [Fistulifera solaris]|uniref:Dickkopf N-terminal cysteine-rich domain-containing protein n=1 Tax=Fistulifera solaris TaxID=1519565 RepID=A0A1Z5KKU8_FISSO|nr:hypothetical protein FisN_9Lu241 [Fistulifera solaris]|eukprot:GAX26933.1 hypothetical protein FisN_9Lu241 [Fistulifera solaris]